MARFGHSRTFVVAAAAFALSAAASSAQVSEEKPAATSTAVTPAVAPVSSAPTAATPAAATAAANPIVTGPGTEQPNTPLPNQKPRRARAISPEVAAQLAAAAPKFTPPPPKPAPVPESEQEDLRDIDKPKNGIVRLPKYIVTEKPPPVLSERAVYTKQGLADLAMKRYLKEGDRVLNALTLPLFGNSNEARAMAMYEEDERLKNMADLTESARMVSATDKAAGLYVKKQVDSTFNREGNFDWRPIGR